MTDRELLEMAARAAGVCLHPESALHRSYGNWGCDTTCTICKKDPSDARWNPLHDDGDALRLAVKLNLEIVNDRFVVISRTGMPRNIGVIESISNDPYAATRRAIVRAAAEIGKAM